MSRPLSHNLEMRDHVIVTKILILHITTFLSVCDSKEKDKAKNSENLMSKNTLSKNHRKNKEKIIIEND